MSFRRTRERFCSRIPNVCSPTTQNSFAPIEKSSAVLAFAGVMVLLSVVLTVYVSPLWMWFTVFIGLNLIQTAFTGFCPAATVFRWLGVKKGVAFA